MVQTYESIDNIGSGPNRIAPVAVIGQQSNEINLGEICDNVKKMIERS